MPEDRGVVYGESAEPGGCTGRNAARWWALADSLLPGTGRMPRPSAVDDADEWTRRLVSVRPDLCAAVQRAALSQIADQPSTYLARLKKHEPGEFLALATAIAGAHYLNPAVRRLIGYPGQEPMAVNESEDGVDDDLLRGVRNRRAPPPTGIPGSPSW